MSAPPIVSVIVVSFNTREMTLACLRSVVEQSRSRSFELIVIDNASTDGSADAIASAMPGVRLMRSGENLGFARANNVACAEARGELLLLLNPDTLVLDGAIDVLVEFARSREAAGVWGGRTVDGDGRLDPTSVWRRMTLWSSLCRGMGLSEVFQSSSLFNGEAMPGWLRDCEREVDIVTGCFLLIRRDLWEKLGGFDEGFFMYGEEADLCLRARELGARPRFTPTATIVHYGGASERVRWEKVVRLFCAKARLMRKHWSPGAAWFGVRTLDLWALTRALAWRLVRRGERDGEWRKVWEARARWREDPRRNHASHVKEAVGT